MEFESHDNDKKECQGTVVLIETAIASLQKTLCLSKKECEEKEKQQRIISKLEKDNKSAESASSEANANFKKIQQEQIKFTRKIPF